MPLWKAVYTNLILCDSTYMRLLKKKKHKQTRSDKEQASATQPGPGSRLATKAQEGVERQVTMTVMVDLQPYTQPKTRQTTYSQWVNFAVCESLLNTAN